MRGARFSPAILLVAKLSTIELLNLRLGLVRAIRAFLMRAMANGSARGRIRRRRVHAIRQPAGLSRKFTAAWHSSSEAILRIMSRDSWHEPLAASSAMNM